MNLKNLSLSAMPSLMAIGAMTMLGMAASTASAGIIYQDSFGGTGALNGATPTVDNGSSATWTAATQWSDSGYFNANTQGAGRATAQLGFTPTTGNVYTLSATVSLTSGANPAAYLSLGFLSTSSSTALNNGWDSPTPTDPIAAPWVLVTIGDNAGTIYTGPGTQVNGTGFTTGQTGDLTNDTFELVLNTTAPTWTYQVYNEGTLVSGANPIQLPAGTTINYVGMQGASAIGTVSNFELSSVPEPATLGLMGVGAIGLLLIGRKRKVA